jgi:hypothetical protein
MAKDRIIAVKFEVGDRVIGRGGLGTVIGACGGISVIVSWDVIPKYYAVLATNEFCESLELVREAAEPEEVPEP